MIYIYIYIHKDFGINQKNVLLFEDKQIFLFLCLRISKILSLGEFDELKIHPFLVHFSDLFFSNKIDLYAEIWNN